MDWRNGACNHGNEGQAHTNTELPLSSPCHGGGARPDLVVVGAHHGIPFLLLFLLVLLLPGRRRFFQIECFETFVLRYQKD